MQPSRTPAHERAAPERRAARRSPSAARAARAPLALAAMLALAGAPATLDAQARGTFTLAGSVVDTTGAPVQGAEVRLVPRGTEPTAVATRSLSARSAAPGTFALSDASGDFVLRNVPTDTVQLVVRRIGFHPASVEVAPGAAGATADFEVALVPNAVQLSTVVVEGRAYDERLWDAGFYKRARLGAGRYYDPEFLATYAGGISTLLRETPRVMVDRVNSQDYAYGPLAGSRCRLNVFVDGHFAREAMPGLSDRGVGISDLVPREEIHAIEIYPTINTVPTEYSRIGPSTAQGGGGGVQRIPSPARAGSAAERRRQLLEAREAGDGENQDAACGALVIWTRPFALRHPGAAPTPPG